jgi:hypothetical protein
MFSLYFDGNGVKHAESVKWYLTYFWTINECLLYHHILIISTNASVKRTESRSDL